MLETALEQLEDMTKVRAYKDAANLLEAVTQVRFDHLTVTSVPFFYIRRISDSAPPNP